MTPVPLHGASNSTRSNPPMTCAHTKRRAVSQPEVSATSGCGVAALMLETDLGEHAAVVVGDHRVLDPWRGGGPRKVLLHPHERV